MQQTMPGYTAVTLENSDNLFDFAYNKLFNELYSSNLSVLEIYTM